MIHRPYPFDPYLSCEIPTGLYVPRDDIPKEFRKIAYGELALSKVYAREITTYTLPFIY